MRIETCIVGQLATNCYIAYCTKSKKAIIVDPGDAADYIMRKVNDLGLKPICVIATHGHFDHILSVTELKLAYNIPFYLHKNDLPIIKRTQSTAKYFLGIEADPPIMPDYYLKEGLEIKFGREKLKVVETPGHTNGSISLYDGKNALFTGDTIFADGGYGRFDLEGGNKNKLNSSIKNILNFPSDTIVYPGHGKSTSIKRERKFYKF